MSAPQKNRPSFDWYLISIVPLTTLGQVCSLPYPWDAIHHCARRPATACCRKTSDQARPLGRMNRVGERSHGESPYGHATSLDGFIAGPNDGPEASMGEGGERLLAWYIGGDTEYRLPGTEMAFKVSPQTAEYLRETSTTTGALVTGRRTFDLTHGWGGGHPLGVPVFVLTHSVPQEWVYEGRLLRSLRTASKAL